MLFQMCYGPEIEKIYESIRKQPERTLNDLTRQYQYDQEGDIASLVDSVLTVLEDLEFIQKKDGVLIASEDSPWSNIEVFRRLQRIALSESNSDNLLNFIFATLYEQLFVKPDRLYLTNIHYQVNSKFPKTLVGHEKINAWKRMMESWGLGRRVYSGFYALPHLSLLREIVSEVLEWEGSLHLFCEKNIHPIIPCLTSNGSIFSGVIFGLRALHGEQFLEISYKQDFPYKSYGPQNSWNWIRFRKRGNTDDTLYK